MFSVHFHLSEIVLTLSHRWPMVMNSLVIYAPSDTHMCPADHKAKVWRFMWWNYKRKTKKWCNAFNTGPVGQGKACDQYILSWCREIWLVQTALSCKWPIHRRWGVKGKKWQTVSGQPDGGWSMKAHGAQMGVIILEKNESVFIVRIFNN